MKLTKQEADDISGIYNGLGVCATPKPFIGKTAQESILCADELNRQAESCDEYYLEIEKLQPFVQSEINKKLK